MNFGVQLHPQFGGMVRLEEVMDLQFRHAALCEKLGFDSVWVNEHHVAEDVYFPPLTLLSALAARTRRVRLGAFVIAPFYRPIELAEQVATIDLVSKGRVILGPVLGYRKEEFEAYGIPIRERGSRTKEVVELTRMLWTRPSVSHTGRFFTLTNVTAEPKPLQRPHPPIWIGAMHEKAVRRAARIGDGWVAHLALMELPVVARLVWVYKKALHSFGKDITRPTVASMVYLSVAEDRVVAQKRAETHMLDSISSYLKWGVEGEAPKVWMDERFIIGDPAECIGRVEGIERVGINYLILRVGYRGMTPSEVTQTIRLFGEKVLPYFKERGSKE
jgi:alkanesulfonate monooxygenase SsuD/methylene tetrahydromethanopterin reductase-like flavin-dependent oxidoreductase (luciferase family)